MKPLRSPGFFSLSFYSVLHCLRCLRHATLHPLTAPQRTRSLRSGPRAMLRHAPLIALYRATLRFLRYHAPHNALLRFSMLFCATLRSIPLLILLYK